MKSSYEVLKSSINQVGPKQVAVDLNVSLPLVYKWCQPPTATEKNASGTSNPLDRIAQIFRSTKSYDVIQWVCQAANGFFVPNPDKLLKNRDQTVLQNTQRMVKEFSEILNAISDAYNHGQQIDTKEAKRIRQEWEDLKSVSESFVYACETGFFERISE